MGGLLADKHARPSIEGNHYLFTTSFVATTPQSSSKSPGAAPPVESE